MTANWPPEHYLSSFDRAAGNALEALQKQHPFRLTTERFNLHACRDRTNVDRPALVLSQCKEFLSVSNTTLFIMFSMERQVDLGYRNSYRRTVAAALLASSLAVMAAIALLITPSGFPSAASGGTIVTALFGDLWWPRNLASARRSAAVLT
jgi:hypothetical protein